MAEAFILIANGCTLNPTCFFLFLFLFFLFALPLLGFWLVVILPMSLPLFVSAGSVGSN